MRNVLLGASVWLAGWMVVASTNRVFADDAVALERNDQSIRVSAGTAPFATYLLNDAATNKPYFWPVFGPGGKSITRAYPMEKVDGEQHDHPHHRGIWFGHEDIGGYDTWTERMTFDKGEQTSAASKTRIAALGSIRIKEIREAAVRGDRAVISTVNEYLSPDGKTVLTENRVCTLRTTNGQRWIDWDQEFVASEGAVKFASKKDAGLCVRVPTSMAVDSKQGGSILNSRGQTDGATWGKRAEWCDYIGPVGGETAGVAILNHPGSFRHPTSWHVRTYGLFTANPFGTLDPQDPNPEFTLEAGAKLVLRHRIILHAGDTAKARIAELYQDYAKE